MARLHVGRRTIVVLLALVMAGGATYALWRYVSEIENRALEEVELAQVYVATGTISTGTPAQAAIQQGLISREEVPRRLVAENAIGSLEQIQGLIAANDITRGEQIVTTRFATAGATNTGLADIPTGTQAVSVEIGVVPGLSGFVQTGDRVAVVARVGDPDPTDPEGVREIARVQYIVREATVLGIGQRFALLDEIGDTQGYRVRVNNARYIYTLAVPPEDIERLLFAVQEATVWFTMLPPEDSPTVTPGRSRLDLFP